MKISKIIQIYKENDNYLLNLEVSKKDKFISFVIAYLVSLIFVLAPLIICSHFFIYSFYFNVVVAILLLLFLIFLVLGEILNNKLLLHFSKNKEIINKNNKLYVSYIVNTIFYFMLLLVGYFVIISLN